MSSVRLVLDTNVWLDWLVFDDPGTAAIRAAAQADEAEIFATADCLQELARVLTYPMRKAPLDAAARADCLARFSRAVRMVEAAGWRGEGGLPRCADADDQKFLELARACRADFLVTRDRDLLVFARRKHQPLPFRIVTPQQFAALRVTCAAPTR